MFLLYINFNSATLGDSAFLFEDFVKMVFPRSESCHLLSSLSPSWIWHIQWDLPISHTRCPCLNVWCLRPISSHFSAANTSYSLPTVNRIRGLGASLDTTFTPSVHFRGAVNAARRLLVMVRARSPNCPKQHLIVLIFNGKVDHKWPR